jgi:hypothetical protein
MLVYAIYDFFSREHSGRIEKERAQACMLLLALLLVSYLSISG